jgi:hypothetical protein
VYARLEAGVPAFVDPGALAAAAADPDTEAGLRVVAPALFASPPPCRDAPPGLADAGVRARAHTLGSWGGAARR